MTIKSVKTRFRAYQLNSAGSSFSYSSSNSFVLIEGRYCEDNEDSIKQELKISGFDCITTLHITSWDQDHCSPKQLAKIIEDFSPAKIEHPGYKPHTDCGKESLGIISSYKKNKAKSKIVAVTPEYIRGLDPASNYGYNDIMYLPKEIDSENANNNSTVKQFRSGSFNVLSLGDVESANLSSYLRRARTINSEVDVMIMAHHGADNGFTTSAFLRAVKPSLAIATSNYGNQFDHPKPEVRDLLHKHDVKLFTTKTGDVIVNSLNNHVGEFEVINLRAGSSEVSRRYMGQARKSQHLRHNSDTLRDRRTRHNRGPRR